MAVKVREWKGAWWVFVDHQGRRKAKRVGVGKSAKKAADAAAEQIQAKLTLGDLSVLAERPETPPTLATYAERWLVAVRGRLKPGTAERYTYVMQRDWVPAFGAKPLPAITRESIKRALAEWLAAGVQSKTVQLRLSVRSRAWRPPWRTATSQRTPAPAWASGRSAPVTRRGPSRSSRGLSFAPSWMLPNGSGRTGHPVSCSSPVPASGLAKPSYSSGTIWT
jgi:hypothetical protein